MLFVTDCHAARLIDRIAAVVNNDIITLSQLEQACQPYIWRIKSSGYPPEKETALIDQIQTEILDNLIDQKIAAQKSIEANIFVSDKEIDEDIDQIKNGRYISDEEFATALKSQGFTVEGYRQQLREQKLRYKLVNIMVKSKIVITEKDIKTYYDTNPDQFASHKKYHLRSIVQPLSEEGETNIKGLHQRLVQGDKFDALADLYSSVSSNGGELGTYYLEQLSEQIRSSIENLKATQFTDIIKSDLGYQIIYVEEVIAEQGISLDNARKDIEDKLYKDMLDEKYKLWLKELRTQSYIKLLF